METRIESPVKAYYIAPGMLSDPGAYAAHYADLPGDVPGIVQTLQGLVTHIFWGERYGIQHTVERQQEVQIHTVQRKLARLLELDPRPLSEERPLACKLVCNCRDISLLCVSMLRAKGYPARARCGFGVYFTPNRFEDHWVVEYWNAGEDRWVMLDAQMDALQSGALKLDFDPLDMPAGKFVTGGDAWLRCRRGEANPDDFGIFEWKGWDFVKGNLFRDLLALNKIEPLPWDEWSALEPAYASASPDQLSYFDRAAALTLQGDAAFEAVRALYAENPRLHAPAEWAQ